MRNVNIPTIALRSMTVLPNMVIHFDISRKQSIKAVQKAMEGEQRIFLVAQRSPEVSEPEEADLFSIGTVAKIKQLIKLPDNIIRVLVEGIERAEISRIYLKDGMLKADLTDTYMEREQPDDMTSKAMIIGLHELIRQYAAANPKMSRDILKQWISDFDAKHLLEKLIIDYPMTYLERQNFLEMSTIDELYENVARMLVEDINVSRIKTELSERVKQKVDKHQKDYILREQLKVLSEELDGTDTVSDIEEFTQKLEQLEASDEIKDSIRKEIKRYKILSQGSSEANVERSYIETLLSMPWDKASKDNYDLKHAEEILERDHYGMKKIKKRIIESLAVRNIADKGDTPIICLVGPPGTGKTSIARSVAEALNKEYVRICLGGVRDEAEIRGHRKTYVGAMPGRIINALKKAGVKNPLMLLDEIDKISNDYKSDTASALLEVLDSEQNAHFVDHYIELPTDLSQVLFIATANDLSNVSRPLLDRMEIIEVNSYTKNEKLHIAKDYLIPKQIKKNGLTKKNIKFTDKAINSIIEGYTREAGVRGLERQIAAVCRKAVRELYEELAESNSEVKLELNSEQAQDENLNIIDSEAAVTSVESEFIENKSVKLKTASKTVRINDKNLVDYLGRVKYLPDDMSKKNEVGIVRGLAWTSVGGDVLEIEVNTMPGKGELILTGKMGEVMSESARIALTYVRSIACGKKYNVKNDYFEKTGLHLHIPAGAVPKDGPSAGITMATAILSAVTKIPVNSNVAMTGEITLRGRVLPIGGLKEKLLAAKTAGIKKVLVPDRNRADVEEFDAEITENLEIVYVKDMQEVLAHALVQK